jgi:DNA-binding PadR family transcriptional regulator
MPNEIALTSDLDLFILALVQRGLETMYDFKARAGLSVGSSGPILARLEKAGLVKLTGTGSRDSRRYSITKAGEKALDSNWQALLDTRPTDFDAVLRIGYLAWALGRRDALGKFVEKASASLKDVAATRRAEANQLQGSLGDEASGQAFRWLRTFCEAARFDAQADALKQAAEEIAKKKEKK